MTKKLLVKCGSLTITGYWITIQISSTTPTSKNSGFFRHCSHSHSDSHSVACSSHKWCPNLEWETWFLEFFSNDWLQLLHSQIVCDFSGSLWILLLHSNNPITALVNLSPVFNDWAIRCYIRHFIGVLRNIFHQGAIQIIHSFCECLAFEHLVHNRIFLRCNPRASNDHVFFRAIVSLLSSSAGCPMFLAWSNFVVASPFCCFPVQGNHSCTIIDKYSTWNGASAMQKSQLNGSRKSQRSIVWMGNSDTFCGMYVWLWHILLYFLTIDYWLSVNNGLIWLEFWLLLKLLVLSGIHCGRSFQKFLQNVKNFNF